MKGIMLLRHGESLWNREDRFIGWTDVDLSERGVGEAYKAGDASRKAGFSSEAAYTSYLKRAVKTLNYALGRPDKDWIPVEKTWRLNEKHYGMLQRLNKNETAIQYGEEQVYIWRGSYDAAPAPVGKDSPRNPDMDTRHTDVPGNELPRTESLKDTIGYVMPYWKCIIFPALMYKGSLLVVTRSNSLHGIIKHFKGAFDTDVPDLDLPTAVPYVFEFDDRLVLVKDYYPRNPEEIWKRAEVVAEQGMVKR